MLKAIDAQGRKLQAGLKQILTAAGIPFQINGPGAMFGILFLEGEAWEFRDVRRHNGELYDARAGELIARGVMPDPDARAPWFLCSMHDDAAIAETLNIFEDSVKAVKGQGVALAGGSADEGGE